MLILTLCHSDVYSNGHAAQRIRGTKCEFGCDSRLRRRHRSYILLCYSVMLNVKNAEMCLKAPCNSSSFILSDIYIDMCFYILFSVSIFLFSSLPCFALLFSCLSVSTKDLSSEHVK